MIDTVVIKIAGLEKFRVSQPSAFLPEFKTRPFSALSQTERVKKGGSPHLQEFRSQRTSSESYLPKIEIYECLDEHDIVDYNLRLEFSVPKLLFENNLQELSVQDQSAVVQTLRERLLICGVDIKIGILSQASVSAVHFGKNFFLPRNVIFREILNELSKTAVGRGEDVTKVQYKNGDETLQIFSGVREYAFYEKIRDLSKPKNKRMDKSSKTDYEKQLIDLYDLENKECFRFEYRLKNYQTIKSEINAILVRDYKTTVAFADLFSETLWKKIIFGRWQDLIKRPQNQLALIDSATNELDLFTHILKKAREKEQSAHSQNRALIAYGLAVLLKNHGVKMVKDEFKRVWSDKSGERFEEKIKNALELIDGLSYSDRLLVIDAGLGQFERIDLEPLKIR